MLIASGPWYTSIILWTSLGTIFGFGVFALAVLAAWGNRIASRRRLLSYAVSMQSLLPLAPEGDLEIMHRGAPVESPSLVQLRIVNKGPRDIPSAAFDARKPLVFDLGIPIVAVLSHSSHVFGAHSVPALGTHIEIGPTLIPRGHWLTLTLLVSGDHLSLQCDNPLIDVEVVEEPTFQPRSPLRWAVAFSAVLAIAAYLISVLSFVLGTSARNLKISTGQFALIVLAALAASLGISLLGSAVLTRVSLRRRRRA